MLQVKVKVGIPPPPKTWAATAPAPSWWWGLRGICLQFLFPAFGTIDSAGTSLLHLVSFGLKTWIAFFVAGCCASLFTSAVLRLFTSGVEAGAEGAGLVEQKDREEATTYIILIIEMYLPLN